MTNWLYGNNNLVYNDNKKRNLGDKNYKLYIKKYNGRRKRLCRFYNVVKRLVI